MDYDQLIRNWHAKASEEDYFSKFVFEYLAFIAYLKKKLYPNIDKDRPAIQELKKDSEIQKQYLEGINSNSRLRRNWQKIKEEFDRLPLGNVSRNSDVVEEIKWWNCSHDDTNQKTSEEEDKPSGVIYSLQDWENMVEFWYSVRNNLFHGGKNPDDTRDRFAVEYGYKTLRKLMEIFLKDEA